MNTNDKLLVKMLAQDMVQKGIAKSAYWIVEDAVLSNPKELAVKVNEVVYTYFFRTDDVREFDFKVQITSATAAVTYEPNNCLVAPYFTLPRVIINYQSNLITRHWSTVRFQADLARDNDNFFVRYIKVRFTQEEKKTQEENTENNKRKRSRFSLKK